MILTGIDATNSRSEILNLPLEEVLGGFYVKEIEGLDPVKATLVFSSFAKLDGEQYQSSRREARNIKIKLGLQPDYALGSVQELRAQLYNFFMPKTSVNLKFKMFDKFSTSELTQSLDLYIDGRIETCEASLFSKDPAVDVSIMCYNPDFVDTRIVSINGNTVSDLTETNLDYVGSTETGVNFTLTLNRNLDAFTIYHTTPDGILKSTDVAYAFLTGDILKISSIVGAKSVILTRAGVDSSILYAVTPQSNWVSLEPGTNKLRVYAVGAAIPYNIQYTTKYGGL